MGISVVVCAHNPRPDYLRRVLGALDQQTLPKRDWELLVVDNASSQPLAHVYDLSWHPGGRHVREDRLGLTPARLRGINETRGELMVFVDDDNVLAPDFLEEASVIFGKYTYLGVFGAGRLEPEFEVEPPPELVGRGETLAVRTVPSARWSNNPEDADSIPWGAGLCVGRSVANSYRQFIERLGAEVAGVLGRAGTELYCGEDDLFSWVAASLGSGFGIFPELRVTHLIPAKRLNRRHLLRFLHDHAMSHGVLRYSLLGVPPRRIGWIKYVHLLLHGLKNGRFSMQCKWAASRGEERAARFVVDARLRPAPLSGDAVDFTTLPRSRAPGELGW
jgi:glycosyltransferase involved in cell wall biosynthesis